MKTLKLLCLGIALALLAVPSVQAETVVSNITEDGWLFNSTNRNELILNNTGTNPGRWSSARYDDVVLNSATNGGRDFTNSAEFTLTSATLTLVEESGRNGNNGTQSGRAGAYFYDTIGAISSWNSSNLATVAWPGNSAGRPGQSGGTGGAGPNNVHALSNGAGADNIGLTSPATAGDGASWIAHAFDAGNSAEIITIDLTAGGASFADIQTILGEWVGGNNSGFILAGEFGNQAFVQSNSFASGASVGSTIDGDNSFSGVSLEVGNGTAGASASSFLTLEFSAVAVPEPSSLILIGLAGAGLFVRRRR